MIPYDNGKLIVQLGNIVVKRRNAKAAEYGLTSGQTQILVFLLKNKDREINQLDLQNDMLLTHQTVTGILNLLEKKGFIRRESSEIDRRRKRVMLTDKALKLETAIQKVAYEFEAMLVKNMSEEEIREFSRLLHIAQANMQS